MTQQSKVAWFELPADDMTRARTFYNQVFGWVTPDMGNGGVFAITTPSDQQGSPNEAGAINGDISPRSSKLDRPLIFIAVDDMDAHLKAVQNAGGTVVTTPQKEEQFGLVWSVIGDTEGNHVGLHQWLQK